MAIAEIIGARRSIRKYKENAEVSDEQIKSLLEAAMMAPSAANGRPWEFVVVKDRNTLEEIMKIHAYAHMLKTASIAILVCADTGESSMVKEFFPQDCAAATMNILLQAVELGLGTCWCGIYPDQGRVERFKAVLGGNSIPFSLIAVGVPDESPKAKGYYESGRVRYI